MFTVYILRCGDNSFYVGHTDDLDKRIIMHARGDSGGYTSLHLPMKLVYQSAFATRQEALVAERRIKGWSRAKKLALIHGDWEALRGLAQNKQEPDE